MPFYDRYQEASNFVNDILSEANDIINKFSSNKTDLQKPPAMQ